MVIVKRKSLKVWHSPTQHNQAVSLLSTSPICHPQWSSAESEISATFSNSIKLYFCWLFLPSTSNEDVLLMVFILTMEFLQSISRWSEFHSSWMTKYFHSASPSFVAAELMLQKLWHLLNMFISIDELSFRRWVKRWTWREFLKKACYQAEQIRCFFSQFIIQRLCNLFAKSHNFSLL